MTDYDIVIVGSGVVGASAALALSKYSHLKIGILEASEVSLECKLENYDARVSAISLASKKFFQDLNVWDEICNKRISSYKNMYVWDGVGKSDIQFNCADMQELSLGYIIEDSVMRTSLLKKISQSSNIELFFSKIVADIIFSNDGVVLKTQDNLQFKTKLVIAADGANSVIRDLANIELNTWEYHHTAIVSTVTFELSHQNTAWQCFLANGPLAFLPLKEENVCSIVWSTTPNHAKELLELNDKEFCLQLTKAFESRLGNIVEATKRFHFPLRMRHAKNYVKNNLVLIGDSAHTIHPLAGQGVNLGLSDAKVLAGVILEALQKNRDYSALHTLRKYERARKTNNVTMLAGIEMIKRLFCSESLLAKKVRGFGLSNVNRLTHLKNFFASYAMGK